MVRRIKDFIRYTASELETYTKCKNSCVKKINKKLHLNFPPYGLSSFKSTLLKLISEKKIGSYDADLNGIILDIRNIKVLGNIGAIRFDDPSIHLNIQGDCYVFQPQMGSVVQGLVKHISQRQIGVIIYRVFSVPIRLSDTVDKSSIALNSEIEFRIKNFDLQNTMPYIEGELMAKEVFITKSKTSIKFEDNESDDNENNEDNLFKKPTAPSKSACEILADSENEEIEFSELSYLNEEEAKKLKEPKKRKKQTSELSSPDTNSEGNIFSPKSILKKSVSFGKISNKSSSESDSEPNVSKFTTSIEKGKSKNLKSANDIDYSTSESENEYSKNITNSNSTKNFIDEPKDDSINIKTQNEINIYNNTNMHIIEKTDITKKLNNGKNKETSDSEDDKDEILEKIGNIKMETSMDYETTIKVETSVKTSEKSGKSLQILNNSETNSSYREPNIISQIKSEPESDESDGNVTQSTIIEHNLPNNSIQYERTTPMETIQEIDAYMKIEVEPYKINGYESEDLFEQHSESQIVVNENNNKNIIKQDHLKNKKKRKISLTDEMNYLIEKNKKQHKQVELSPAHSTQKNIPDQTDKCSNKSTSDASFNEAFKEILNKTKRKRLSESECTSVVSKHSFDNTQLSSDSNKSITKYKSSKSKNSKVNSSMADILQRTIQEKIKNPILSKNFAENDTKSQNNKEKSSKKKSKKRKISLNESMNTLLAQMITKKSKAI